jgi:hypothetical protein
MSEHSRKVGPQARHVRAADALIAEVVTRVEEAGVGRCDFEAEDAARVLIWKVLAACAWGVVLVMLVSG